MTCLQLTGLVALLMEFAVMPIRPGGLAKIRKRGLLALNINEC